MSSDETKHLDDRLDELREMIFGISGNVNHLSTEVQTIKRGVYGDKENGVKGLIDRIKNVENLKLKIMGAGGGAFGIAELIHWLKEMA